MFKRTRKIRPLGTLEEKVMAVLWSTGPLSVREVNHRLAAESLAHTTVMTTLDRLFKKDLLSRTKEGVAYVYTAAVSKSEYQHLLVEDAVSGLIAKSSDAVPVLAAFVDAAAQLDKDNLVKLETLIAQKKEGDN